MAEIWYHEQKDDIIVSSRVRLARNYRELPFEDKMTAEQKNTVWENVKTALEGNVMGFEANRISELSDTDRRVLVEAHLMSPAMLREHADGGVILSKDKSISVLVNEEDHLRMQCIRGGNHLREAWELLDKLDDLLENEKPFAFDEKFGYLTACPTNVGTGMRASVMLHLPALEMTGYLNRVLKEAGKLGIDIRGIYGEGSEMKGSLVQLSNQTTLGVTEAETIERVEKVIDYVVKQERAARERLKKELPIDLEDRIMRSYGQLKFARKMSSKELLERWSDVRFGIVLGFVKDMSLSDMGRLLVESGAAHIEKQAGKELSPDERDVLRCQYLMS